MSPIFDQLLTIWNRGFNNPALYMSEICEFIFSPFFSKQIRDTLKKQMDQKGRLIKHEFESSQLHAKYAIEQDKQILEDDKQKRIEKMKYLTNFRNENKQVDLHSLCQVIKQSNKISPNILMFKTCSWCKIAGLMTIYQRETNGNRRAIY